VTEDLPNSFEADPEFAYLRIPIRDHLSQDLAAYFQQAIDFINNGRSQSRSVLVHCLAGISRSVTITVAYLMAEQSLPMDEALDLVKSRRPFIAPNFNFMGQLLDFQSQLGLDATTRGSAVAPLDSGGPHTPLLSPPSTSLKACDDANDKPQSGSRRQPSTSSSVGSDSCRCSSSSSVEDAWNEPDEPEATSDAADSTNDECWSSSGQKPNHLLVFGVETYWDLKGRSSPCTGETNFKAVGHDTLLMETDTSIHNLVSDTVPVHQWAAPKCTSEHIDSSGERTPIVPAIQSTMLGERIIEQQPLPPSGPCLSPRSPNSSFEFPPVPTLLNSQI
jgi:hypothetical protein